MGNCLFVPSLSSLAVAPSRSVTHALFTSNPKIRNNYSQRQLQDVRLISITHNHQQYQFKITKKSSRQTGNLLGNLLTSKTITYHLKLP